MPCCARGIDPETLDEDVDEQWTPTPSRRDERNAKRLSTRRPRPPARRPRARRGVGSYLGWSDVSRGSTILHQNRR